MEHTFNWQPLAWVAMALVAYQVVILNRPKLAVTTAIMAVVMGFGAYYASPIAPTNSESVAGNQTVYWVFLALGLAFTPHLLSKLTDFFESVWPANDLMKRRMLKSAEGNDEAVSIANKVFFSERPSVADVLDAEMRIDVVKAKEIMGMGGFNSKRKARGHFHFNI